jgi:hypothetical protein
VEELESCVLSIEKILLSSIHLLSTIWLLLYFIWKSKAKGSFSAGAKQYIRFPEDRLEVSILLHQLYLNFPLPAPRF